MAETDAAVLRDVQDTLLHPEVVELAHAEKALARARKGLHTGRIAVRSETTCGVPNGNGDPLVRGFSKDSARCVTVDRTVAAF